MPGYRKKLSKLVWVETQYDIWEGINFQLTSAKDGGFGPKLSCKLVPSDSAIALEPSSEIEKQENVKRTKQTRRNYYDRNVKLCYLLFIYLAIFTDFWSKV